MAISKKKNKIARNLFQRMRKLSQSTLKAVVNWVLRALLKRGKRPRLAKAGFALPTTIMVLLVVTLLTTTLVLRSMDRNRNAINARSEQVIQNTSTPALDRAKAKLTELLADPELPRGTPPDSKLLEVMAAEKYTFGDETRLKLAFDLDGDGSIENQDPNSKTDETLNTAWRYPVDTDGNGKFDSFTLYGMYWRGPDYDAAGQKYDRDRKPVEARSVPQDTVGIGSQCKSAGKTAATSVESDWFQQGGNLSKAFYTYVATVPISKEYFNSNIVGGKSSAPYNDPDKFEPNLKGGKAFSGLEYQQDRYRSGLNNTSVWYENDIVLSPGDPFRLNGRVFTNGNLLIGGGQQIKFHQVSDPFSCFYEEANAKINVGGNVVYGDLTLNTPSQPVTIDLFQGKETAPQTAVIDTSNQSTSDGGNKVAYNDAAYIQRLTLMKQTALSFCTGCEAAAANSNDEPAVATVDGIAEYPDDLVKSFKERVEDKLGGENNYDILSEQIELYLRNRTRRVPYAEVSAPDGSPTTPAGTDGALGSYDATSVFGGSQLEPPAEWREPEGNTGLTLVSAQLSQTNPDQQKKNKKEDLLGDRVNVGNNLPALWKKDGKYVGEDTRQQYSDGTNWNAGGGTRYRTTQIQAQEDVGASNRGDYWELAAAADPTAEGTLYAGGGGLRVVTGAGIYVDGENISEGASYPRNGFTPDKSSLLTVPPSWDSKLVPDPTAIPKFKTQDNILVWPDLMPMTGGPDSQNKRGDLRMRATAVYHYVDDRIGSSTEPPDQLPIACVSSYYDPTDQKTARNPDGLPDVSGGVDTTGDGIIESLFDGKPAGPQPAAPEARSNNGVVYSFPGRGGYNAKLLRQARLVFPDGRIANEPLRKALSKVQANYNIADYSAIDTAICAIAILDGTVSPDDSKFPHGAIKESSFLDAREVKAIDKFSFNDTDNYDIDKNYDLPLEQRQPLEVRVTDIDMRLLAGTQHGTFDSNNDGVSEDEYLLPNSGIIYATRDDALPDLTDPNERAAAVTSSVVSPTDFKLDPTRRPNGIRIINGLRLARGAGNDYDRKEEKGLILVTNVPAYVKGHFNLHLPSNPSKTTFEFGSERELEEFTTALNATWSNFYSRGDASGNNLERRFACREGQPLCDSPGDQWRTATIIADAITLQSENYKEGYRNQGDFDLRNNGGGAPEASQVGSGFFDNSFVTSANWFDDSTNLPNTDSQVSYLLNGVTPVQRRARVFAYGTEICTKVPVSACQAGDWKLTIPPTIPTALDTSQIPTEEADRRYARRVAFKHTPTGQYLYDPDKGYPQLDPTVPPTLKDNALWFKTRAADDTASFAADREVTPIGGGAPQPPEPFIFQPPEVPDLGLLRGYLTATPSKQKKLDDIPDLSVGQTDADLETGTTPTTVIGKIETVYESFINPTDPIQAQALAIAKQNQYLPNQLTLDVNTLPPDKRTELTGGGVMGVYTASNIFMNANRPLTLKGDAGSVFVFIVSGQLTVNGANAMRLEGVVPENVYWILTGSSVSVGGQSTLYGNVLTKTGNISLRAQATLEGRAFSSGTDVDLRRPGNQPANYAKIIAPKGNQPRLVPVAQIHSPAGSPAASTDTALDIGNGNDYRNYWLQQPKSTNYNAAFVVGDSPNRPAESSAGLHNLVRFQENWSPENGSAAAPQGKQTATIKGSFIQLQRSSYATAPFGTVRRTGSAPVVTANTGELSIFGYGPNRYQTTVGGGTQPYYSPPIRQWGFDVGLLSQSPDLFSQRFTSDISKTQNYYRQVGRDDPWVKTLLCAAEPADPSDPDQRVGKADTGAINYSNYAVPSEERPDCRKVTNAAVPYPPTTP